MVNTDNKQSFYKELADGELVASSGAASIKLNAAGYGQLAFDVDEVWHHKRYESDEGLEDLFFKAADNDTIDDLRMQPDKLIVPFSYFDGTLLEPLQALKRQADDGEPLCLRGVISMFCDGEEYGTHIVRVSDKRLRVNVPYDNREDTIIGIRNDDGSYRHDVCECVKILYDAANAGVINPFMLYQFTSDDAEDKQDYTMADLNRIVERSLEEFDLCDDAADSE